jgi:hypothetical protein
MINKPKEGNGNVTLEIKNGILHCCYIVSSINLEQAKDLVAFRLKYTDYTDYPIIIRSLHSLNINKEARQYLGTEGKKNVSICALVATNPFMTLFVNLFLKLDLQPVSFPCKVFNNEKAAMRWLRNNIAKMVLESKIDSSK